MSKSDDDSVSMKALVPKAFPQEGQGDVRRETIKKIVRLLPRSVQPYLVELFRASESEPSREAELFSALRSTLNTLTQEGVMPRRTFLQIAGLVASGGLAPFLYPDKAYAWQAWTGFWQNINNNPYMMPTNTGLDPYWDYVTLLMNFDGINGSTVFTDESNIGKTPTLAGTPSIDTSAGSSPYSGKTGSAKFGGSDSVRFEQSSDFDFGANDFTIETWIYFTNATKGYQGIIDHRNPSTDGTGWVFYVETTNKVTFLADFDNTGSWDVSIQDPTAISANTWCHYAVTRSGSSWYLYRNGILVAKASSVSGTITAPNSYILVGKFNGAGGISAGLEGRLSDLRTYKNYAKYVTAVSVGQQAFTPTTAPIGLSSFSDPYWGYCVLACPFENTLKDMSGKRATASGAAALSTSVKKYGSASASFNGSNSSISFNDITDFDLGVSNQPFTLEAFVYLNASTGSDQLIFFRGGATVGWDASTGIFYDLFYENSSGKFRFNFHRGSSASAAIVGTTSISTGTWYHVAVSYDGTLTRLFVNGNLEGTSTSNFVKPSTCANASTGAILSQSYLNGYIDSLRITKGYARYTQNFTPPTAAFPVGRDETVDPFWTYTVLAMHMDDLSESTGRHSITNNGSLTVNSTTKRLGAASASFDGASQYLTTPSSHDYNFTNGDFTIELWIKTSQSSITALASRWPSSFDNGSWILHLNVISNKLTFHAYGSGSLFPLLTSVTSVNDGVWHHVAVARLNGTSAMYIDGIQQATSTTSYTVSGSGDVWIGNQESNSDRYFNGNIDDLRITKGVARYAQNFTPPTRAFATTPVNTYSDFDPFFANVVLLMQMDGTNGSTAFTDLSSSAKAITNSGGVTLSTSVYRFGSASGSFNGSSQILEVASSPDFSFGTGAFTIEFWMYPTIIDSTYRRIIGSTIGDWSGTMFNIRLNDGNILEFTISDPAGYLVGSTVIAANNWYHVVGVFNGNEMNLYVNGELEGSVVASGVNVTDTTCYIGGHGSADDEYFAGYLDDIRITKGVARCSYPFVLPGPIARPRFSLPTSAGIVTSGLVAFLDAGDPASYDGTLQTWKNIVISPADSSGQSDYDFNSGASTSVESSDPTFIGVSGGRSANDYFSFDGGDYFTLSAGSNTTFLNSLHKTGAAFTIVVVDQGVGSSDCYFGTAPNSASSQGICYTSESNQRLWVSNGSSLIVNTNCSGSWTRKAGWNFHALAVNAGAGTALFYLNGSNVSKSISYSGASSGSSLAAKIASAGNGGNQCFSSGARVGSFMIYNRALSASELDQIFAAIRSRFGI